MGRKKQKKRKRNTSNSSVENEVDNEVCVSCKKVVEEEAVECYWCSNWQHIQCAKVSKSHYDMLNTCPDQIVFFCSVCIAKLPTALEKSSGSKDSRSAMDKQIEALQSQLTDLAAKVNDQATKVHEQINSRFLQFENKVSAKFLNSNSVTHSLPTAHEPRGSVTAVSPSQIIKEYKDRESRKFNVIVHNVPESESTESSACVTHDTNIVGDIANKIGIESIDIATTMRLGEKIEGRSRLLKVHLRNLQHKRLLLSNAKKLKGLSGDLQKVYITPDLSRKDRQENKLLREELFRRRSNGELGLIIRRGQIVFESQPTNSSMDITQAAADQQHA